MPEVVDLAGEAAAWLKYMGYALILLMLGTKFPFFRQNNADNFKCSTLS